MGWCRFFLRRKNPNRVLSVKLPLQRYDEAMEASNSSFGLCNLQSAHRAVRCRKLVGVDSEPVQHREVEVGEWIVVVFVEAQVLPVFEITTSQ